jgi:hypothetical protein
VGRSKAALPMGVDDDELEKTGELLVSKLPTIITMLIRYNL